MFDDSFKKLYKNVPIVLWHKVGGELITALHNHSEFEISIRTRGASEIIIGSKKFEAGEGDIFLKNPFEPHSSKSLDEGGYCFCFDCSLIADETIAEAFKNETLRIANHIPQSDKNAAEIKRLFMNVVECYMRNGEYMELEIKAHISLFIAFLMENGYVERVDKVSKAETFYKKVFKYILQNYTRNITSKDVADALSYNHSYFCRKFQNCFNRKFYDYLNMYRIFESKKLFLDKEKTITQIAMECGFNNQTYFAKCFKKYTGILPSEYKQKINLQERGEQI